ncbi:MAG: phage tail protein [Betaproteobacteria bacterium]|nr:phage tail protein [Betaproteobacteria bacterium]
MSDQFVAEIRILACNFPPKGWAFCNGQLIPISQNTALFSLVGTFYGGDGKTTFALPDLQGRFPMHPHQGPGLTDRVLGETGGQEGVALLSSEMPQHTHTLMGGTGTPQQSPSGNVPGQSPAKSYHPGPATASNFDLLQPAGGGAPHNNMPPYLVLNFCIAQQGIFPARS